MSTSTDQRAPQPNPAPPPTPPPPAPPPHRPSWLSQRYAAAANRFPLLPVVLLGLAATADLVALVALIMYVHWIVAMVFVLGQVASAIGFYIRYNGLDAFLEWPLKRIIAIVTAPIVVALAVFVNYQIALTLAIVVALTLMFIWLYIRRRRRRAALVAQGIDPDEPNPKAQNVGLRRAMQAVGSVVMVTVVVAIWLRESWQLAIVATLVGAVLLLIWNTTLNPRQDPNWPLPRGTRVFRPRKPTKELLKAGKSYVVILHPINILPSRPIAWIVVVGLFVWSVALLPFWPYMANAESSTLSNIGFLSLAFWVVLVTVRVCHYRFYKVRHFYGIATLGGMATESGWWRREQRYSDRARWSSINVEGTTAFARRWRLDAGTMTIVTLDNEDDLVLFKSAYTKELRHLYLEIEEDEAADVGGGDITDLTEAVEAITAAVEAGTVQVVAAIEAGVAKISLAVATSSLQQMRLSAFMTWRADPRNQVVGDPLTLAEEVNNYFHPDPDRRRELVAAGQSFAQQLGIPGLPTPPPPPAPPPAPLPVPPPSFASERPTIPMQVLPPDGAPPS